MLFPRFGAFPTGHVVLGAVSEGFWKGLWFSAGWLETFIFLGFRRCLTACRLVRSVSNFEAVTVVGIRAMWFHSSFYVHSNHEGSAPERAGSVGDAGGSWNLGIGQSRAPFEILRCLTNIQKYQYNTLTPSPFSSSSCRSCLNVHGSASDVDLEDSDWISKTTMNRSLFHLHRTVWARGSPPRMAKSSWISGIIKVYRGMSRLLVLQGYHETQLVSESQEVVYHEEVLGMVT